MPTYEYLCEKCGREFEVIQSISSGPLKICPKDLCGRKKWGHGRVKRKISAGAGMIFKGGGFYINDYRSEAYKAAARKDSMPAKSSCNGAKPAAKPEGKPAKPVPTKA